MMAEHNQVTPKEAVNEIASSAVSPPVYYDNVAVSLVPEKKGLFLKHSEYEIRCLKQNYCVYRRYNDFVTLQSFLISKYPCRLITRLPPKQIMMDSLLNERRKGLQNWLKITCAHPILSQSAILSIFMTDNTAEYQDHLRDGYQNEPNEFSRLRSDVELPLQDQGRLACSRETMKRMLVAVTTLKRYLDNKTQRTIAESKDMEDVSTILRMANSSDVFPASSFQHMADGTHNVSLATDRFAAMQERAIGERLTLILEVLSGHSDLCDRVEKGILADHQKALSKMLSLNKEKVKVVIRGGDNVNALHDKEERQMGVVGKLGDQSAFSLYCILQETSLAEQYLQSLPSIMLSFCHEQHQGNKALAEVWSAIVNSESQKLNK